MFHSKHGLFFDRLGDGAVRIIKTNDTREPTKYNVVFMIDLTASEWASVLTEVAASLK